MQMSPYKFDHGSSIVQPEWVHVVSLEILHEKWLDFTSIHRQAPCPDVYRGKHRLPDAKLKDEAALAEKSVQYSDEVKNIIQKVCCDLVLIL